MSQYRQPLDPDTALGISISATISRHRYGTDPSTLLAELNEMTHGHPEILAEQAGGWVGYYGHDLGVQPALVDALRSLPGAEEWVALGVERRSAGGHSAPNPPRQECPHNERLLSLGTRSKREEPQPLSSSGLVYEI